MLITTTTIAIFLLNLNELAQSFSLINPIYLISKYNIVLLRRNHKPTLNAQKPKHESELILETKKEKIWNEYYSELCNYVFQHGNCLVPLSSGNNTESKLGVWVRNQRRNYAVYMNGNFHQSSLTPERIRALDAINFVWDIQEYNWCRRYQELCEFRLIYGHTLVPQEYNTQLAAWVLTQRTKYKKYLNNIKSKSLNKHRIDALNSIDFCWTSVQHTWKVMFQALSEYNQVNGHFDVPSSDVTNIPLRSWIQRIRNEYAELQVNPSCKCYILTPNRIESLDSIGFSWNGPRLRSRLEKQTASLDDWGTLFDRMRESGIDPSAKPKSHWFEGESRFDTNTLQQQQLEKDDDEDFDLDSLWNQEEDFDLDSLWNQEED